LREKQEGKKAGGWEKGNGNSGISSACYEERTEVDFIASIQSNTTEE